MLFLVSEWFHHLGLKNLNGRPWLKNFRNYNWFWWATSSTRVWCSAHVWLAVAGEVPAEPRQWLLVEFRGFLVPAGWMVELPLPRVNTPIPPWSESSLKCFVDYCLHPLSSSCCFLVCFQHSRDLLDCPSWLECVFVSWHPALYQEYQESALVYIQGAPYLISIVHTSVQLSCSFETNLLPGSLLFPVLSIVHLPFWLGFCLLRSISNRKFSRSRWTVFFSFHSSWLKSVALAHPSCTFFPWKHHLLIHHRWLRGLWEMDSLFLWQAIWCYSKFALHPSVSKFSRIRFPADSLSLLTWSLRSWSSPAWLLDLVGAKKSLESSMSLENVLNVLLVSNWSQ